MAIVADRRSALAGDPLVGGRALVLVLLLVSGSAPVLPEQPLPAIVGGETPHSVRRGESLATISARFGVDPAVLAAENGLAPDARLQPGQVLRVDNRHIVPGFQAEGIRINVPQKMLFEYQEESVRGYPVGLGRPDWQTPTGRFAVAGKELHPVWHVPRSIQEEMRREGKRVLERVPPGPENPLGDYWIALSGSACGIHGTNAPSSVYRFRTHGCIRLHPDDVAELFPRVFVGLPVEIVYRPVLITTTEDGAIWLEVHADVYRTGIDMPALAREIAASAGLEDRIDWTRAAKIIRERAGVARRVDLRTSLFTLSAAGRIATAAAESRAGPSPACVPLHRWGTRLPARDGPLASPLRRGALDPTPRRSQRRSTPF